MIETATLLYTHTVQEWLALQSQEQLNPVDSIRTVLMGNSQELLFCLLYGLPLRNQSMEQVRDSLFRMELSPVATFQARIDAGVYQHEHSVAEKQAHLLAWLQPLYTRLCQRIEVCNDLKEIPEGLDVSIEWQRLLLLHGPTPDVFQQRQYSYQEIGQLLGYTKPEMYNIATRARNRLAESPLFKPYLKIRT